MLISQLWKLPKGASTWTLVGTLAAYSTNLQWMSGQFWTFTNAVDTGPANTLTCMRSADGVTWTTTNSPVLGNGHCSMHNAVHNNEICMFYANDSNDNKVPAPFQLVRVDQTGTFSLDTPTPGVSINPSTPAPSVARYGGTLFTRGQNAVTPNSGIWARNT